MNKSILSRTGFWISTAGLAFCLLAGVVSAQPNLIVNGSFEVNGKTGVQNFPDWDWLGPADNNSDFGVAQASVSPDVAEQGSFYAYFHGNPTDGSQDCLGETVHLTVGASYTISYYLATDGTTLGSGAAMWVVIGTSFGIDLSQDVMLTAYMPDSASAQPYQLFTTNYIATNSSAILSFHGIDATSTILLDNVSMTPVVPQLKLNRSSTNTLVFTWNAWTNGFRLQTNASLVTANWGMLTNVPVNVAATNQIVMAMPGRQLFYRLALP